MYRLGQYRLKQSAVKKQQVFRQREASTLKMIHTTDEMAVLLSIHKFAGFIIGLSSSGRVLLKGAPLYRSITIIVNTQQLNINNVFIFQEDSRDISLLGESNLSSKISIQVSLLVVCQTIIQFNCEQLFVLCSVTLFLV